MKIRMILTVALLMAQQCRAAAVPWALDGKAVTPQAGASLQVPANAMALAPAPALPYEFRFEALVPGAVQEEPDFGTPQIWFSADYRGAQDRLAFALRGGRLQDAMAYDFHQQGWVGVVTGQMFEAQNQAFGVRFHRLPDRESAPMAEGKWVSVSVRVTPERAGLWVNGKFVMTVDHPHGAKSAVALGGSWQANTFRNVEVLPLAGDALAALATAPQSDAADAAANEKRRQEQRARYAVKVLPEAPAAGFAETSLDGDWLFMPEHGVEAKAAPAPGLADGNWHVLPVPGFWSPIGWWIWGQSPRHISRAFLYEELARCEPFTFDWKKISGGWYRQHLMVPASYAGKQVCLEFGGVASLCDVYVNGVHAGGSMGMFKPFSVDLTPHLRAGESNLVAVWVGNGEAKWGKKGGKSEIAVTMVISREMVTELPRGIYSNPQGEDGKVVGKRQGGIWQSVRLRVGDPVRFGEIRPQTSGKSLKLKVEAAVPSGAAPATHLQVRLKDAAGKTVLEKALAWPEVTAAGELQFADLPVALWSPEVPTLYSLELELTQQAKPLDKRTLNIGFRDFGIRDGKFVLNGTPWRFLGANMPPHGIRPNDKELAKKFIGFMRQGNQRGVRCHGSPFPPEWLDETDRQGIAVSYEGQWPWVMIGDAIPDEAVLKVWKDEWIALVKANRHRPSIVMWTLNNECYSLEDKDVARRQKKWDIWQDIVQATREADPTRPIVIWSGHTRANQVDKLATLAGPKDDGDIDDRHAYTGTYTPSMLYDPVSYWKDKIKQFKTPGRPFICQEGGTAYANTDVGHQELSYLQTWHGQSWTGRQSYPNASPSYFQARLARITKEQLEITRYQDMEGWLAFCNGTWYHNADRAGLIRPYPVHESVRLALQPRLVALMRPPQRVFEGHRIPLQVYGVNDAERNLGTQWQVEVLLESREGAPLSAPGRVVLPEPTLGGGVREAPVTVAVNAPGLKARQDAVWHVTAKDAAGRVIAENRYEVGLFPAMTEPMGAIPVLGSKAALREWSARLEKLGVTAGGDLAKSEVGVALAPAKGDWTAILKQATSGKRIVVLDPKDLPKSDVWGGAKLTGAGWNGEVAEVTEAGRQRGLAEGLRDDDLAWWQGNGPELGVYFKALTFAKPYPEAIQPLVDHVPPHGYGGSWAMDFPVVRFPVGQGEVVICTLNVSALDRDPAPFWILRNLIKGLQSGTSAPEVKGRPAIPLSGAGWKVWLDKGAAWQDDTLYAPGEFKLEALPVKPPTGGWDVLGSQAVPCEDPACVEQIFADGDPGYNYHGVSWFVRSVPVPVDWKGKVIKLDIARARLRVELFVNRRLAGYDLCMESPCAFDVTPFIRPGEVNEIAIRITNPGGSRGFDDTHLTPWGAERLPSGRDFGGIDTVTLSAMGPVHLADLFVMNRLPAGSRNLEVRAVIRNVTGQRLKTRLTVKIAGVEKAMTLEVQPRDNAATLALSVPDAKLWSPAAPNLYVCETTLSDESGVVADTLSTRFGFRTFEVKADRSGKSCFYLNGERFRHRSAIDFSYHAHMGMAATVEQVRRDITAAKAIGHNGINCHRHIGEFRLLDAADELGLAIYEEPGGMHQWQGQFLKEGTLAEKVQQEKIRRMAMRGRNHPCLLMHNLSNEDNYWGPEREKALRLIHAINPAVFVCNASGHCGQGDVGAKPYRHAQSSGPNRHFRPYEDELRMDYQDDHTVGNTAFFDEFTLQSHARKPGNDLFYYGEVFCNTGPANWWLVTRQAGEAKGSYDLRSFQGNHDLIGKAFTDWNLASTCAGAIRSPADVAPQAGRGLMYSDGRLAQRIMANNSVDGFAINGWSAHAYVIPKSCTPNHDDYDSALVDEGRNLKGPAADYRYWARPAQVALFRKDAKVVKVGQAVSFEIALVNEAVIKRGPYKLEFSVLDGAGRKTDFSEARDVAVQGGDCYAEDWGTVSFTAKPDWHAGHLTLVAELKDAAGKVVADGREQVLLQNRPSWKADLGQTPVSVVNWPAAAAALSESGCVIAKDDSAGILVAGARDAGSGALLEQAAAGKTLVLRFNQDWAQLLEEKGILSEPVTRWGGTQTGHWNGNGWGYIARFAGNQGVPYGEVVPTTGWEAPCNPVGFYPLASRHDVTAHGLYVARPMNTARAAAESWRTFSAKKGTRLSPGTEEGLFLNCGYDFHDGLRLKVPNGTYKLTLRFCELHFSTPGFRVFDVKAGGKTLLKDFDIVAAAGAAFTPVDRSLDVTVDDGVMKLEFINKADVACLSAIVLENKEGGGVKNSVSGSSPGAITGRPGRRTWC